MATSQFSKFRVLLIGVGGCIVTVAGIGLIAAGFIPPALTFKLTPHTQTTYRFHYKGQAHSDIRPLLNGKQPEGSPPQNSELVNDINFDFDGEMTRSVILSSDSGYLVALHWNSKSIQTQINGNISLELAETLKQELAQDTFVDMDRRGHILGVHFVPAMSDAGRSTVKTLLSMIQYVVPDNPSMMTHSKTGDYWDAQEVDNNGDAVTHYTLRPKQPISSYFEIDKKITRYDEAEVHPLTGEVPVKKEVTATGLTTFRLARTDQQLLAIRTNLTQKILIANREIAVSKNEMTLTLAGSKLLSSADLSVLKSAVAPAGQRVKLSTQRSSAEQEEAIQKQALGTNTAHDMLAELNRIDKAPSSDNKQEPDKPDQPDQRKATASAQDTTGLFLKLKALVSTHPEVCEAMGKRLSQTSIEMPSFRLLASALESTGSRQAQLALVDAIRTRKSDSEALQILIPSLAMAAEPIIEAQRALEEIVLDTKGNSSVASTAQLALGTVAFRLLKAYPERANQIVKSAIDRFNRASDVNEVQRLLLALGNSANPLALPTLLKYAEEQDTQIRGTAVYALRFQPAGAVDKKLINILAGDTDTFVRSQAAVALYFRPLTSELFVAQKALLQKEVDPKIRTTLLTNLWKAHETMPEVRDILNRLSTDDPDSDVRRAALDLLSSAMATGN